MLNVIKPVNLNLKESCFDFWENRSEMYNSYVYSDRIEGSSGFVLSDAPYVSGKTTTQIKEFDGLIYSSTNDGYLYCYEDGLRKVCDYKVYSSFNLSYVDYQNDKAILVTSFSNTFLLYNGESILLPFKCTDAVFAYGRIFYYDNYSVCFTKPYDYFAEPDGVIKISAVDGFRKICLIGNEVYLVYRDKILKIPAFSNDEDFKMITVLNENGEILNGTVFGIGENIFYVKNRIMHKFNGKTVEKLPSSIPDNLYGINTTISGEYKGIISFKAIKFGSSVTRLYQFDTNTNTESFIDFSGSLMPWFSACINNNGKLLLLNKKGSRNVFYQSVSTDLSIQKPKSIYCISCYSSSPVQMVVKGDFGEKMINLKKGYNQINCNFKSLFFTLSFSASAENLLLKGLKIKYTVTD